MDARVVYEGFGRRLLAGLLDLMLLVLAAATLALLVVVVGGGYSTGATSPDVDSNAFDAYALSWTAAFFALQSLCWALLGATPGMLLLGCQVLRADTGRKLSLARSFLRSLALFSGIACLGVGVLWMIRDPRRQGLHDKLVRSVVVREDESLMSLEELVEAVN
jgi:uncharacterized RDD family membrane protein YckC